MQKWQLSGRFHRAKIRRSEYIVFLSLYLPYLSLSRACSNLQLSNRSREKRSQTEDRLKVLEWLAPPELRPPVTGTKEPGTNVWFLEGELFHDWLAGEKQYLFVHGGVGCGKTTLLKSAAKSCQQRLGEIPGHSTTFVVTFFFSSTANQHLGLNELLRYLVGRLSPLDSIPDALYEMYRASTKTFPPEPPNDNEELIEVLSKILTGSSPSGANPTPQTYILLDGLDEIATLSECRKVTRFLNHLTALNLQTLHILVTSRSLELSNPWQPIWDQYAIPAQEVARDIELYVRRVVSEELSHLMVDSQRKIITGLTGPKQTM
jgi:predicted NACHT family NTPase